MLEVPGLYFDAFGTGINNLNHVVGWTSDGANTHGSRYSPGAYSQIDFPGANMTEAWDINDDGIIVGWYSSSDCICTFALQNGHFASISYPGARGTAAEAINGLRQVVGAYTTDFIVYHGFVTSPIPATVIP